MVFKSKFALILFFAASFLTLSAQGNWNQDFLEGSFHLGEQLPSAFAGRYLEQIQKLLFLDKFIFSERNLVQKIGAMSEEEKGNFFRELCSYSYVIKKRAYNNINEAFFWELSILLSLDAYVIPSFAFEIANKHTILQYLELLVHGGVLYDPPLSALSLVTLGHYWKGHLLAYLLGSQDLSGTNIGITSRGSIRLFDNEDAFLTDNIPRRCDSLFNVPFVSVAFDWPQYKEPIDAELARSLKQLIASLQEKKALLPLYAAIREVPEPLIEAICERIDHLSHFPMQAGVTFSDFYAFLYPQLYNGLDALAVFASHLLQRPVSHGVSLFYVTRILEYAALKKKDQEFLKEWIVHYIGD